MTKVRKEYNLNINHDSVIERGQQKGTLDLRSILLSNSYCKVLPV